MSLVLELHRLYNLFLRELHRRYKDMLVVDYRTNMNFHDKSNDREPCDGTAGVLLDQASRPRLSAPKDSQGEMQHDTG